MKKLLLVSLLLFLTLQLIAQAPQQFSFQGVARDAAGKAVANATIGLRLTIHSDITIGPTVYQETHSVSTGPGGIFTVQVGTGNNINGVFGDIAWGSKSYFLQVELDPTGGITYTNMGASQILSVPYALHAEEAGKWKDGDPIVQTGALNQGATLPAIGSGAKLIWYPRRGAFRAGGTSTDEWEDSNIGQASVAFGYGTKASGVATVAAGAFSQATGEHSVAVGYDTKSVGYSSFAMGVGTTASGSNSIASGFQSVTVGSNSLAMGHTAKVEGHSSISVGAGTLTKSFASATFGSYNNVQDNPNGSTEAMASKIDRIFQIGNGSGEQDLSNALTILRNGKVGLGNGALIPQFILDIDGRMRLRQNGESAGLWLNNSQQEAKTFIGMQTDTQVGFYIGDDWRFSVNTTGQGRLNGSLIQTSDRRLKKDFSLLSNSLSKVNQVEGYHFIWKNPAMEQSTQTGFIAQEVETIFPELVITDDKGFKSVNYIGFIPHLLESVKALKKENDDLKKSVSQLSSLEARVNTLTEMLQTLTGKQEAIPTQTK